MFRALCFGVLAAAAALPTQNASAQYRGHYGGLHHHGHSHYGYRHGYRHHGFHTYSPGYYGGFSARRYPFGGFGLSVGPGIAWGFPGYGLGIRTPYYAYRAPTYVVPAIPAYPRTEYGLQYPIRPQLDRLYPPSVERRARPRIDDGDLRPGMVLPDGSRVLSVQPLDQSPPAEQNEPASETEPAAENEPASDSSAGDPPLPEPVDPPEDDSTDEI